ncbi:hypothetical protein [Mesorhizobium sp.]|uniref:hypothetical protein n=1 Tax=Mesorhizobium sp. TaxID=1871066 RepID=UPI0012123E4D|nr:hypothetical protein [Mesorhizobium sp.]TIL44436.1 MAG: hypothetical protein E5Y86_16810 [Mesorhizobium sp.]
MGRGLYVATQGLNSEDGQYLVNADGQFDSPSNWNDVIARQQATIDLLARARVIESTVGMYGDLQGIAGKVMQEIEGWMCCATGKCVAFIPPMIPGRSITS